MADLKVHLPYKFKRRSYQQPLRDYMVAPTETTKQYEDRRAGKRACIVWHRRTGKDKTCLADHVFPAMYERIGAYHYYFPTAADGRAILWDGMDKDGFKFMDHFPPDLIENKNNQEMKIKAKNGSLFQIVGTDRMERVGTNPVGCVFSEYSKQNPSWWDLVRPILAENGGWAIKNFTPRGKNHAFREYRMAQTNKTWFAELLTADDTDAITQEAIQAERDSGMSEELIQQEFYCSFDYGAEGAYYSDVINNLYSQGRITNELKYHHGLPVYSVCDPGYHWAWALFQIRGLEPVFLRAGEDIGLGVEKYAEKIREMKNEFGYRYIEHFAPIDTEKNNAYKAVAGKTLVEHAKEHGLHFSILSPERSVLEGIERTRKFLFGCWFVANDCELLLDALQAYCAKKIAKISTELRPQFENDPDKTWANHLADVVRYASMAVLKIDSSKGGVTNEQIAEWSEKYRRT